ncbi:DUF551 domain-containing protein [Salmonella enterica]
MLAATCEKYIQMLVTWVKDRKPFQPAPVVPDDGRAEFEAWMLKKWGRERQEYDFAMSKFLHGENYADSYTRHMWKAWTESRAAMLQSKYRDLSQPVDPQISEYEKIILQAGNSPVIPDGYALVPVEPTDEMIAAAMNCEDVLFNSDESFCVQFGNIYEAMLAAAPKPQNAPQNIPENIHAEKSTLTPDGWISCSERMPAQDDWVLIYSNHGEYLAGQVQGEYVELNYGTLSWLGSALHWMPLPEPPQQ